MAVANALQPNRIRVCVYVVCVPLIFVCVYRIKRKGFIFKRKLIFDVWLLIDFKSSSTCFPDTSQLDNPDSETGTLVDLKQIDYQVFPQQRWFQVSKELQFRSHNHHEPYASPTKPRKITFKEKSWESYRKQKTYGFLLAEWMSEW